MNPTYRNKPGLRPAYAMNGWIMLLFLLLIAVCVFNAFMQWSRIPASATGAYAAGVRIGIWVMPVIGPLIFLGIAWCVGKVVSLMFGKSDDAGNIGASVVLLGALSLYGYGAYVLGTAPAPTAPTPVASGASSGPSSAGSSPHQLADGPDAAETNRRAMEEAKKRMDEMAEQSRRQQEAAAERMRKQTEALRTGQPMPPPTPPPAPPNTPNPSPSTSAPPSPSPAAPSNPAIRTAIDAFTAELNTQINAVVAQADTLLTELARTPPHDITRIKKRSDDAAALRASADALAKALRSSSDDLTAKLIASGIADSDARTAAFNWSGFEFKSTSRMFAAESIVRLCDKASDECTYLRDNMGKWTLDSKGVVKCSDFTIKSTIDSNRFFVKAEADRKAQTLGQLQGR